MIIEFDHGQQELIIKAEKNLLLKYLPSVDEIDDSSILACNAITLDLTEVEDVDLNGIQFILFWLLQKKWKTRTIKPVINAKIRDFLLQTGFQNLLVNKQ